MKNDCRDHLAHYGIKGQQWGKRNYQNEDGTFNEAGKARYFGKTGARKVGSSVEAERRRRRNRAIAIGVGATAAAVGVAALGRRRYNINRTLQLRASEDHTRRFNQQLEQIRRTGGKNSGKLIAKAYGEYSTQHAALQRTRDAKKYLGINSRSSMKDFIRNNKAWRDPHAAQTISSVHIDRSSRKKFASLLLSKRRR